MKNIEKTTFDRIPLEERLRRLEAGNASSPQCSRRIIDRFCETPVFPALESMGAFDIRETFCELLKEHYGWKHASNVTITFGELAALITDRYITYNSTVSKKWKAKTLTLISIYFTCIDTVKNVVDKLIKNGRGTSRNDVVPMMRSVYDFMYVSLEDFNDYALSSGLPALIRDKRNEFRNRMGFTSRMSPIMLYRELKYDAGLYDYHFAEYVNDFFTSEPDDFFKIDSDEKVELTLEKCSNLINYFICPIAAITQRKQEPHSVNNSKRNSDTKRKGEKYYE